MTPSERIAILGGTFTPIHNGHRTLLHKAFQTASHDGSGDGHVIADDLDVELNRIDDAYLPPTRSFDERARGPAATRKDIDALVVSPEAKAQRRAHEFNQQRVGMDLRPLEIHTPPFVIDEDGSRISSTRIRNGETDVHGRVLDQAES